MVRRGARLGQCGCQHPSAVRQYGNIKGHDDHRCFQLSGLRPRRVSRLAGHEGVIGSSRASNRRMNVLEKMGTFGSLSVAIALAVLLLGPSALAQTDSPAKSSADAIPPFLAGPFPGDLPTPGEIRCKARAFKPFLGFEFRFLSGYFIEVPIRDLAGPPNELVISVTVRPISVEGREPVSFGREFQTRALPARRGTVELSGSLALGEGKYDIQWQLRDRFGRFCSESWTVEAKLSKKDRGIPLILGPGEVAPSVVFLFREEISVRGGPADKKLRVKLLVSMDVRRHRQVVIRLWQYSRLVAILRSLSRSPSLVEFSLVAFSLEDQQILYQQDYSDSINFPALGRGLGDLTPATVTFDQLGKTKVQEFLANLLAEEVGDDKNADAYVFVGSDIRVGKKIPRETLAPLTNPVAPVFYLNSTRHPWRGMLGNAVKTLKGTEYKIRQPREVSNAVEKMVGSIRARRRPVAD